MGMTRDRQQDYLQDVYDDGDVWEMRRQRDTVDQERLSAAGPPVHPQRQVESDTFHKRVMQHLQRLRDTNQTKGSTEKSTDN